MRKAGKAQAIRPDWVSKTLAGALLGLVLAYALVGLLAWTGPGGIAAANKSQFNMWMIPPLWMTVFSLTYLFHSGLRAWLWLGGACLLAVPAMLVARQLAAGG